MRKGLAKASRTREAASEALDAEEVQRLSRRDAEDAVDREPADLGPLEPQAAAPPERDDDQQDEEGESHPQLGEPLPGHAAEQQHLADRAVEREERRGREVDGVAEGRPPVHLGDGRRLEDRHGVGAPGTAPACR